MSHDLIALHEQAAQWFMRRSEPGWTGADQHALTVWLAASPQHREIYEGMALTSHDLHHIPLAQKTSRRPHAASAPANRARGAQAGRRAWLTAALAACALLAVGAGSGWQHWQHWQHWQGAPAYELAVATAPGEVRTLDLPDGSTIVLNINSKLTVRYGSHRREVVLEGGEAFFKVARDAQRPFTVASGASEVKAVGTAFNVRVTPAQIVVKVREGRVEVRPDSGASQAQIYVLNAGGGLGIHPASHRARSIAVSADTVGDWRSGQLHFRSAPLAEVAADLQHYLGQPVVVEGALARQPISGVASTREPRAFLLALPALLPLRVQQQLDGSWRITAR
ncbi:MULTISPECIES: FecR domain-containing protein [unclassified Duganella]|uniref:FecR family protein n=1 Tax=unclassified Duganella TaxID=2636909 RepID=UPI0008914814|nr:MULTISPECIES: FecR domain-containing protein [unclassified Duganella]SDF57682.1 FecR family protein [Duganella sp. OV458]SDI70807.1 FecR family protein [Duganella sp. OV510]